MRSAQLTVRTGGVGPEEAYRRIRNFARYPELSSVVRAVTVREGSGGEENSDWEVYFRNGILRWTEADRFDEERLTIAFRQLQGDFEEFSGTWRVRVGAGCLIEFAAEFDFGIPSLAGILDPVAERVLKETIATVLTGLFPDATVVGPDDASEHDTAVAA